MDIDILKGIRSYKHNFEGEIWNQIELGGNTCFVSAIDKSHIKMKIGKIEANSSIYNIQEFQIDNPLFYDKLVKWLRDFEDISGLRFNESLNNLVKLYARVVNHDYLIACSDDPAARQDRYWRDYYDNDTNSNEIETIEIKVPQDMVDDLLAQGTSEQYYSDGYEAFNDILKRGRIHEKGGKIIKIKKDIAINDNHILEAGDIVRVDAEPQDNVNSFILEQPIVIDNFYVEKGDYITIFKSKRDADKKNKSDKTNDDDDNKDKNDDKEDDDKVDVKLTEQIIIGNFIFEKGDRIRIIPKSKSTVSRFNNRTFRLNEDLTIGNKKLYKNSVIEVLKKEKKPVINISGSDVNILRETWV